MSCFSHDSNARNDARLLRLRMEHGPAGYGIYCMLLEMLAERAALTTDYAAIAFDLHVDAGLVRSVVEDYGLFEIDGATFFSRHPFVSRSSTRRRSGASEARRADGVAGPGRQPRFARQAGPLPISSGRSSRRIYACVSISHPRISPRAMTTSCSSATGAT